MHLFQLAVSMSLVALNPHSPADTHKSWDYCLIERLDTGLNLEMITLAMYVAWRNNHGNAFSTKAQKDLGRRTWLDQLPSQLWLQHWGMSFCKTLPSSPGNWPHQRRKTATAIGETNRRSPLKQPCLVWSFLLWTDMWPNGRTPGFIA